MNMTYMYGIWSHSTTNWVAYALTTGIAGDLPVEKWIHVSLGCSEQDFIPHR